jgi:chromosome segregation ATPase
MSKEIDDMKATFARKEEDFQETIESYKAKLFQADEKLAANVPLPDSPNVSSTFDPEAFIELRDEVDLLKDQVDRFREDNSRLKAENEESSFSTHSLRLQISELKESLEDKEGELASYRDSMRQVSIQKLMFIKMKNFGAPLPYPLLPHFNYYIA